MAVSSALFPTDISYGSRGGPEWSTEVIVVDSGHEQRIQRWSTTRRRYDVGFGVRTPAQLKALIDFFIARRGRLEPFLFKDPFTEELVAVRFDMDHLEVSYKQFEIGEAPEIMLVEVKGE